MSVGRHAFDFLHGTWSVRHRRLRERLVGDDRWDEFDGTMQCRAILGGLGNIDEFFMPSRDMIGSTLRLYDLHDQRWCLHWSSSLTGRLEPPVYGDFIDGVGTFYGDDHHEGVPIQVRFVWDAITPTSARWSQAFSTDEGHAWETNWIMTLERQPVE